ncbi:MAG: DUF4834 family protein [Flavobacteriaceae bacterium]|nr:DUF4834 family protein [Flavobacteriaceae bacterium]
MQLLRTIAIIFLVYYGLKIIVRFAFPMILKRFVGKFEEKVRSQQQQQASTPNEKVGETVIDKKPISTKESKSDVGEYVDYEELE